MTDGDVEAAQALSADAFLALDRRTYQRDWPDPAPRPPERASGWVRRTRHLLSTDPGGCWVAEGDGAVVGFATSLVRELMWVLASYAVRPDRQGEGIGRQLLDAALHHGRGCLRGMLNASQDQQALRRYRLAGFDLHPQMLLWGPVAREVLPVGIRGVREGSPADFELMDSVDRRTRGAAHGPDHPLLAELHRLIVLDRPTGSGYAYVGAAGGVVALAATSRRAAAALTWEALASSQPDTPVEIGHVTPGNTWALDVATAARLEIHPRGFLATRHLKPPAPYLPHPTFL
jgi:GNAT superfamily N-acetyltransferase